jgi:hypothetical protein
LPQRSARRASVRAGRAPRRNGAPCGDRTPVHRSTCGESWL